MKFERMVARMIATAATVTRRQRIPASLHLAATTDLHVDSTVPLNGHIFEKYGSAIGYGNLIVAA